MRQQKHIGEEEEEDEGNRDVHQTESWWDEGRAEREREQREVRVEEDEKKGDNIRQNTGMSNEAARQL